MINFTLNSFNTFARGKVKIITMIENPKENNDDLTWDLTSLKKALTPREFEIAKLVLDGKTSVEIAQILQIRPRTVEVHRYNTLRKLRIRNSISLIKRVSVGK